MSGFLALHLETHAMRLYGQRRYATLFKIGYPADFVELRSHPKHHH
jgi:hypothetical protein